MKGVLKILMSFCISIIIIANITTVAFAESNNPAGDSPVIATYNSDLYYIGVDKSATLKWKVNNAVKVEIIGEETNYGCSGPCGSWEGSLKVYPKKTSSFVIKVYGINGEIVTRALTINVVELKIENFSSSKEEVLPGESVLISWNVSGASNVNILGLTDKDLPSDGVIEVTPSSTTTYTLVATGFDYSFVSSEITVKVSEGKVIDISVNSNEQNCG